MKRYSRPRKRSWRSDEREVKQYLAHWLSRRLSTITRNDVAVLHERMGWSGLTQYNSKCHGGVTTTARNSGQGRNFIKKPGDQ